MDYTPLEIDKDGNKRRSSEVVADSVYFGDSKRDGDGGGYQNSYGQVGYTPGGYVPPSCGYPAQPDPNAEFSELTTDDGDLPF